MILVADLIKKLAVTTTYKLCYL